MKTTKRQNKRNDLTLEIKERIKEYPSELSPEQIVGVCSKNGLSCVSTESIYQHIWKDKRKGNLYLSLRTTGKRYRKKRKKKRLRGVLSNRRLIEDRPVDLKQRFGDLEIDTIIGKNHKGAIVTINDSHWNTEDENNKS
jgi:IS30 family transposase